MHNLCRHLHGSCTVHPDPTLTSWETSRTTICRCSTISWLIVSQLMETRFMFPANRSQQVMRIEYASRNVVKWSLKKGEKKNRINYTLNPLMAVRKYWKLYSNPCGTLCHPWKCSVNVVIARLAEPEMVYDFTVSLGYSGFGVLGEHSELYSLCFLWYWRSLSLREKKGEWRKGFSWVETRVMGIWQVVHRSSKSNGHLKHS